MPDLSNPNMMPVTILLALIGWKLVEHWFGKINKNLEHDAQQELRLAQKLTKMELELDIIQTNTQGLQKINTDLSLLSAQMSNVTQELANVRMMAGKVQTLENACEKSHLRLDDLATRVKQLENKRDNFTQQIEYITEDNKKLHARTHDLANNLSKVNLSWHIKKAQEGQGGSNV